MFEISLWSCALNSYFVARVGVAGGDRNNAYECSQMREYGWYHGELCFVPVYRGGAFLCCIRNLINNLGGDNMKRILFQGDSITDVGRIRDLDEKIPSVEDKKLATNYYSFGMGYSALVTNHLGFERPNDFVFYNRGISGNRVTDLYARVKNGIINLKPDVMSILIGVNDVWHEIERENGVDADKYFKIYSMLIEEIKSALPDIKIMILEPFLMKGADIEKYWDVFRAEVEKRAEKAKEIAKKYDLTFVPLQEKFDEACKIAPVDHWTSDGVHPTGAGHEIIKREWLKAFDTLGV